MTTPAICRPPPAASSPRSDLPSTHRLACRHGIADRPHVAWEGLVAGSLASVLSALALAWAGSRQTRSAATPLNAVSQWRWGDRALREHRASGRYTALGYAIHHGASVFWGCVHAAALRRHPQAHRLHLATAGAAATSVLACFVDFRCTPERFTPGFQHHLSRNALAGTYAAFGVGLALGAWALRVRARRDAEAEAEPTGAGAAARR